MEKMTVVYQCLAAVLLITVVHAGETCTDETGSFFDRRQETFYCEHGCCGDYDDRHCCLSSEAGRIVGIVIGCLVAVGLIVTVIVAICCCLKRSRGRPGQVVTNQGVGTVQMTTVQAPYSQPYMTQPMTGPYPTQPLSYPPQPYPPQQYPPQPYPPTAAPGLEPPKYNEVVNQQQ